MKGSVAEARIRRTARVIATKNETADMEEVVTDHRTGSEEGIAEGQPITRKRKAGAKVL